MKRDSRADSDFRSSFGSTSKSLWFRSVGLVFLVVLVGACASKPHVTRTASDEVIDVSGFWNDSDSQMVSSEMVNDSLGRPWIDEWRGATGKKPTVIVGSVRNQSSEHINTRTFTKDLERAFVNSGRVRLVASSDERSGMRSERLDQLRNSTIDTAKSMGKEIGADFMLIGGINSIIDAAAGTKLRFYQVEPQLIHLESNEKVWIVQKKSQKVVTQSRFGL